MAETAFEFAIPGARLASRKPRSNGQTMLMDVGLPLGAQQDWLDVIGPFVDMAKLVTGTASLYRSEYLQQKLALYDRHQIKPFIGGNFLENVFSRDGYEGATELFRECCRIGIKAVEVSETVKPIGLDNRVALIKMALDSGLQVHAEVGSKLNESALDRMEEEIGLLLNAGAHNITIEGAELMTEGVANTGLCERITSRFDLDHILFELCGPHLPRVGSWETYAMMRFLVSSFGPEVNIGNATPEMVVEIEAQRRGLNE